MAGLPDAESSDQSWMQPETGQKRPVALYSDFNPPASSPSTDDQAVDYLRKIYRFLVGAAIGGIVGLVLYILIVHL